MNRYRGTIYTKFKDKPGRTRETVALGDNIETAKKKMIIELYNSFKYDTRIEEYKITSITADTTPKPTFDFVKTRLLILNDKTKSVNDQNLARHEIYETFRKYSPEWDDDELSNALSYCEEGLLTEYCKNSTIDNLVNDLLDELDSEWVCHYRPELPLEQQYLEAIS